MCNELIQRIYFAVASVVYGEEAAAQMQHAQWNTPDVKVSTHVSSAN